MGRRSACDWDLLHGASRRFLLPRPPLLGGGRLFACCKKSCSQMRGITSTSSSAKVSAMAWLSALAPRGMSARQRALNEAGIRTDILPCPQRHLRYLELSFHDTQPLLLGQRLVLLS